MTHADPVSGDVQRGYLQTSLVVRLAPGFKLTETGLVAATQVDTHATSVGGINGVLAGSGAYAARPVTACAPADSDLASQLGLDRMYMVMLDGSGVDSALLGERLAVQFGNMILSAEPVMVGSTHDTPSGPNDPGFPYQYGLRNIGQNITGVHGTPGADVRAMKAWELSSGSGHITIAVLDSGVSYDHPDLYYKLVDTHNVIGAGGPNDANDFYNSHGTHVAGIAAASSNNAEGMTGMSWGSPIMPIKVANILGFTSDVWIGEGLIWAADHEARVAVISLGLDSGSDFLHAAVQYATQRGVVVCASTGNTGQTGVKYPAKYPETIAVAATDSHDDIADFSTRGPEVTVAAPGVDIISAWDDLFTPPTYQYKSGTSAACPLVGGIVALMLSEKPSLNTWDVIDLLKISSIDKGTAGFDPEFGYGRIDAYRAVAAAKGIRVCPADVNRNGRVENSDFSAWLSAYNTGNILADQNLDGEIQPSDFSAFLLNYNLGCE